MSDDPRPTRNPQRRGCALALVALVALGLFTAATQMIYQWGEDRRNAESNLQSELARAATSEAEFRAEIEDLQRAAARREAEIAARVGELTQREAAIAGREDAATERVQSSFQGLLIQQNLLKNLEALKAGLPDMTPEVERLAKEHAQFDAEVQRLRKENAELRRKLNSSAPLESR